MSAYLELNSINMMQDGLTGAMKRQEAVADNMANVNTPGYKRKEVSFQDSLKQAYLDQDSGLEMQTAHPRHIGNESSQPVKPTTHEISDTSMRNDKNNVDPDREMAKQAKTSLYYNGLAQFERQVFSSMGNMMSNLRQP